MKLVRPGRRTAFVHRGKFITYDELLGFVGALSGRLPSSSRVALFAENRPEWAYALYGAWLRGSAVVPVDFMSNEKELSFILKDAEPELLVCSNQTLETARRAAEETGTPLLNLDELKLTPGKPAELSFPPERLALLPYTSGTTGSPKGVMLTFGNLYSNVRAVEKVGVAGPEDVTLAVLPFHHTYPLMTTLLLPLYLGAQVVFLDELSPQDMLEKMRRYGVTVFVGVPRLYELLVNRIKERINERLPARLLFNLSRKLRNPSVGRKLFKPVHESMGGRLRYMVSGGAKLPLEVALDLTALGFTVLEGYGLTETSPIVSFNPPGKVKLGSVGLPIEGVEVKISDEGEILVKGPNVMKGYWKRPDETARVIKDGWLHTGDLGYLDQEGYLYVTGRKKELIVLPSGKNVFPEEIERELLKAAPFIKEVGVFEKGGKLYALIYPDLEKVKELGIVNLYETLKWEVVDRVNRSLPEWKRLAGFKVVKTELPKTRLGKLKRYLLPSLYEKEEETPSGRREEHPLIAFLEKLSGRPVLPEHHLELDLGLDSLAKLELLAFLDKSFGVKLTEEELARRQTVKELLELVDREQTEPTGVSWREILLQGSCELPHYPLVFEAGLLALRAYFKLYHRMEVLGLENLPRLPFILAPNHQSYLDAFAVASALPTELARNTYFIGDEKYFKNPLTALFARLAHVITVNLNRGLAESLKRAACALRSGKAVLIFPEGARTRTGALMEFKKGVAILAKELGVPVVPVGIKGGYEAWSVYDKLPKPAKITVLFGKPLTAGKDESYEAFTERLRRSVFELLYGKT
ncbi:MAG: AMP-binding protein [Aquificae bacterium]|nr:AMP-binding protein [Aquificota bacterium]